jgi:hypothetical protein
MSGKYNNTWDDNTSILFDVVKCWESCTKMLGDVIKNVENRIFQMLWNDKLKCYGMWVIMLWNVIEC